MEESTPAQAASRYRKVIEGFKSRLRSNPDLKLSEYCKESHTNYRGVTGWTKRHGISILELRREAHGVTAGRSEILESDGTFIQFMPSGVSSASGVSGKYALKVATGERGALLPEVVSWNSSDPGCAVISEGGVVAALTPGEVVITALYQGRQAACRLSVHKENVEYIDLGTGILWADRNQGAYYPEQYGGEYHHEITGKMPGKDDWERLMNECSWVPAEEDGVTGFRIYGKTESTRQNSIFLPYDGADPGFGYWTADDYKTMANTAEVVLFSNLFLIHGAKLTIISCI